MLNYLLIHGGMQGGWCWDRLVPFLKGERRQIFTPCLSGMGSKTHLLTPTLNLSTHIQDIVNIIDKNSLTNVTLVGHSYGGMVATGVADLRPHAIKKIIYLDAVLAESGQSMATAILPPVWEMIRQKAFSSENSWMVPAMTSEEYGFERQADRDFVKDKSTPQPLACFTEPLFYDSALHGQISAQYIFCQKSTFLSNMEKRSKDMKIPFQTINAGHFSIIEQPELVVDCLGL